VDPYTQKEIDELISCPKVVTEPPKKEMRFERGSKRNDMRLQSKDGEKDFSVFIRVNEKFPENFSIGLEYHPKDGRGSIILLRCNGPHGDFETPSGTPVPHTQYHIHKAKEKNLVAGDKPERGGEPTTEYATYMQAIHYLLKHINASGAPQYFPITKQIPLTEVGQ
jgi:hypothetical protein